MNTFDINVQAEEVYKEEMTYLDILNKYEDDFNKSLRTLKEYWDGLKDNELDLFKAAIDEAWYNAEGFMREFLLENHDIASARDLYMFFVGWIHDRKEN